MRCAAHPLALLAGLALLTACGGDDDTADPTVVAGVTSPAEPTVPGPPPDSLPPTVPPSAPPSAAAATVPETMISVADARLAVTLALPDEHAVINAGEHDFNLGAACMAPFWQLDGGVDIEAWPASCDPGNSDPGNGEHGHYRGAADAPAPIDPIEAETGLGPAEVFGQNYYECTNSCTEWELDIAVITLSEPVDDEYPALTVIGTTESFTRDDLLALIESFTAG